MASVNKERLPGGGISWVVRWREGGKQRKRRCASRAAAVELQRSVQHAEDVGEAWAPAVADIPGSVPLLTLMTDYLRYQARRLQPRTLTAMAVPLELFVRRCELGDPSGEPPAVTRLTSSALEAWHDELRRTGRNGPRKATTVRKYLAEVEAAWRWGWERAEDYPGLPRFRSLVSDLRVPVAPIVVAPTWHEMDQAIAACRDEWVRRAAVVMRFTGLRVSQVLRLTWDDVDLEAATLTVRPELGKSRQERRGRTIPVSPHLVAQLAGWGVRSGLLVRAADHRTTVNLVRDADARLRAAWQAAGVRPAAWTGRPAHSFRKGVESGLLSVALPYIHVEAYLGHVVGRTEGATSGAAYVDAAALPLAAVAAAFPPIDLTAATQAPRRGWVRRVVGGAP